MKSILVVSKDPSFIKSYIKNLKKELNLTPFTTWEITPSPSINIEEVRNIKSILTRKPYQGKDRLIVLNQVDKATIQAQNALLKLLEDPPNKTFFVLSTSLIESVLPTVISRCQLVVGKNNITEETTKVEQLFKKIITSSPGEKISLAEKQATTRQEALFLTQMLILYLERLLIRKEGFSNLSKIDISNCIKKIMAAESFLKNNSNVKLTLDVLFLGIP